MPKDFGTWMSEQANSIPDASEVKGPVERESHDEGLRKKAFRYALLNNGEPRNGHETVEFFLDYRAYLAGFDMFDEFDKIDLFSDDFDFKMAMFYKHLEKFVGIGE